MDYTFGVEIEAVVTAYADIQTHSEEGWRHELTKRLENRTVPAAYETSRSYRTRPDLYNKWLVTGDGSLRCKPPYLGMEIVSPKLTTHHRIMRLVSEPVFFDVWEAVGVLFTVKKDSRCGGHVHVTPVRRSNEFTLNELKAIAFATVFYEDYVVGILPESRKSNGYCVPNTTSGGVDDYGSAQVCRLEQIVRSRMTNKRLGTVALEMQNIKSRKNLRDFMQANRYVLWNFGNICPGRDGTYSGTVEFRGGSQFRNTESTLSWVAFVIGFITLAREEDLLNTYQERGHHSPTPARMAAWWGRIQESAGRSNLAQYLEKHDSVKRGLNGLGS